MPRKAKKENGSVLVIDDDKEILETLRDVIESEGYTVYTADEGDKGLLCVRNLSPDIILLDIWLPHVDGLELLQKIKAEYENIPVVMISGHAGIETAVRATKHGAVDFIEKPFTIDKIMSVIETYVAKKKNKNAKESADEEVETEEDTFARANVLRKNKVNQKTIAKSVVLNGQGLMSGKNVGLQLLPSPPDSGIKFVDIASGIEIPLHPNYVSGSNGSTGAPANSTCLSKDKITVRTVEHLLATLNAYGITNLVIKVDEEIPNTDGSAIDFCKLIEEAEITEQREKIDVLSIEEEMIFGEVDDEKQYMIISPSEGFEIELRIDFEKPIGVQSYKFNMKSGKDFAKQIAPARTFNTLEKIDEAQKNGIAGSGKISSHIILHENKIINTELKFENEFVRHKILDVIGDLYLLARPMKCKIKANRTSHSFNHKVVKEIAKTFGL